MTIYDRTIARLSRRDLMKLAWLLGAAAVAPPIVTRRVLAKPIFDAYPFPLGIASGDPLPDSVVLWTRLAPKPLEGGGVPAVPIEVEWQIGEDEALTRVVQRGSVAATPDWAHSVHVEVEGLQPDR